MKKSQFPFYRRIYLVIFLLIALLCALFTVTSWLATTSFYESSTQLMNRDVAAHIATFTSPFGIEGFDRRKADSVFYQAMVLNPSIEVYFLDTAGTVIYFHGGPGEVKIWRLPTDVLLEYIREKGSRHITGIDPRDPDHRKIFSAAAVEDASGRLGYIYVVIGNQPYRSVAQMLRSNRVIRIVLEIVLFIISCSLLITLLYMRRIRRRLDGMMRVLDRFRSGDLAARFTLQDKDEIEPVAGVFNRMADLLLDNIRRVTASEKERKDFMVNISHDLRTPLAISRGYAETLVLKKEMLSEMQEKEYALLVVEKIRRVESMVNQLFELSKMESASFEPHREPFVFSDIVLQTVNAVAASHGVRDSRIDCIQCTDGTWVEADISMMERVIQNLLVNALAYTPEDGRIRIVLERVNGTLLFQIENTGGELSADLLEWMKGEAMRPPRTAIGLTIVRKILQLHYFPLRVEVLSGPVTVIGFRMPIYAADRDRPV